MRNIFDLTSLWKKAALQCFEEEVLEAGNKDDIPMLDDDDDGWEPDCNRPEPGDLEYMAYPEPRLFV